MLLAAVQSVLSLIPLKFKNVLQRGNSFKLSSFKCLKVTNVTKGKLYIV